MNACDYASIMVEKSERTIREWRKQFFENEGKVKKVNMKEVVYFGHVKI